MEHDEAVRSQAAERYTAHALSPGDRDAFEEHFFNCGDCAAEVRFELAFAANVRAVAQERRPARQPGLWEKWRSRLSSHPVLAFSFAGNLGLAAALLLVEFAAPRAQQVQFLQAFWAPAPTRGAGVNELATGSQSYVVRFPGLGPAVPSYSYTVLDAAGKREIAGSLQPLPTKDDQLLRLSLKSLPEGIHTLVVVAGPDGAIVSWSRFHNPR